MVPGFVTTISSPSRSTRRLLWAKLAQLDEHQDPTAQRGNSRKGNSRAAELLKVPSDTAALVPEFRRQVMPMATVLIVDDTPTNVGVISGVLKGIYKTKVATNGEKALVLASASEKPDLILLDVMMPGMDGYEVCRRLKANPLTRDIPVIFLTAKTNAVDEEIGFGVGAVDYIHKPFSAPLVLARVKTQLALRAALSEAHAARNQADELLHALLPKKAADEIRAIGTVIPRRYENVAVLFCDVTNFTSYCDKQEPEDVVSRLDALFVIFERIAAKHGLEKIKTIGDGFHGGGRTPPRNRGSDWLGHSLRTSKCHRP